MLYAAWQVEKRAIKTEDRVLCKSIDQKGTSDQVREYIEDTLCIPWDYINVLCPPINDWGESWNYDVLEDAWPQCLNYLFAPASHMAATMSRACYEYSKGKSTIVLVQESLVSRVVDELVTRRMAIYGVVGKCFFKPYKTVSSEYYTLYFFLTPTMYIHVMSRRAAESSRRPVDAPYKAAINAEKAEWIEEKY